MQDSKEDYLQWTNQLMIGAINKQLDIDSE